MTELTLTHFMIQSAFLFSFGVLCIASKRNAIGILMGVELVLNAANVNFVAFARFSTAFQLEGQIFALMVIVLAAGEAAVTRARTSHPRSPPRGADVKGRMAAPSSAA